jgi:hypothetical protein
MAVVRPTETVVEEKRVVAFGSRQGQEHSGR